MSTDAFRQVFELGVTLRSCTDDSRRREALESLQRFATDLGLDDRAHHLAIALLEEFG